MNVLIKGIHIDEIFITPDEEEQPELIEAEPLQEEPAQEEPKPEPKPDPVPETITEPIPEPLPTAKEAPKKIAPKKNTKPIDKGKIGALHKAGWSASAIADEMKLGLSTVYKIIKEIQEANK